MESANGRLARFCFGVPVRVFEAAFHSARFGFDRCHGSVKVLAGLRTDA